jgi:hypothetical protein
VTDPLDDALRHRAHGSNAASTAEILLASGVSPIVTMKAIRGAFAVSLGDAKAIVFPMLSKEQQASAERLWDEAEAALRNLD